MKDYATQIALAALIWILIQKLGPVLDAVTGVFSVCPIAAVKSAAATSLYLTKIVCSSVLMEHILMGEVVSAVDLLAKSVQAMAYV